MKYIFTQFMVAPLGLIILTTTTIHKAIGASKQYAFNYLWWALILIFMNNRERQKQDAYRITFYAMISMIGLFLIEIIRSV